MISPILFDIAVIAVSAFNVVLVALLILSF
ncbi:hypothetical protein ABIF63_003418 [Bradyrhizobium japonicum]|uniref:Uncharacterized protein n=1 Tax=Bradyrhizobium japonicum TaxID=375 RepID=A0ABV2RQT2_BRAJP